MSGEEFQLPERIRGRSSDGLATGEGAAGYVSAARARKSGSRGVGGDAELDGLPAVDVGDLQHLALSLPIPGADRDSAELLPDDSIERFALDALAEEGAEFGLPPIKKIQPT